MGTIPNTVEQYMNVVSRRMGLRKLPLPKPTATSDDLLQFLVTHLVHCDAVFADEKQRLYLLPGLNLSSISACRAVSLFDTRHPVNIQVDDGPNSSEAEQTSKKYSPPASGSETLDDSGYDTGKDSSSSEPDAVMEDMPCDISIMETDSDVQYESDSSSVTEDGYLAGNEDTGTILWRHVEFYIVRNPVPGHHHILAAIVTLLHTKGEDRKP